MGGCLEFFLGPDVIFEPKLGSFFRRSYYDDSQTALFNTLTDPTPRAAQID